MSSDTKIQSAATVTTAHVTATTTHPSSKETELFSAWKKWKMHMESDQTIFKHNPAFTTEQREGYYRYVYELLKVYGYSPYKGFPGWMETKRVDWTKFSICSQCNVPAKHGPGKCDNESCRTAYK